MSGLIVTFCGLVAVTAAAYAAPPPQKPVQAAQKPAPAAKPEDPAKVALGMQILEATRAKANATIYVDLMIPSIVTSLKTSHPEVPEKVLAKFRENVRAKMLAGLPRLLHLQARVLARHYSMDELRGLAAFYKSKLGQRLVNETPKILQETVPIGRAWGQESGQDAMAKAIADLRKQGVKI